MEKESVAGIIVFVFFIGYILFELYVNTGNTKKT
jgi:hypothetical protein